MTGEKGDIPVAQLAKGKRGPVRNWWAYGIMIFCLGEIITAITGIGLLRLLSLLGTVIVLGKLGLFVVYVWRARVERDAELCYSSEGADVYKRQVGTCSSGKHWGRSAVWRARSGSTSSRT